MKQLNDRKMFEMLKRAVEQQGDALAVACKRCGAPPWKPCMSPQFRPTKAAHLQRRQVAYALSVPRKP